MRVDFISLTLENFGSFVAPQTIDFKQWAAGLYYVTGKNEVDLDLEANGVGKSTLLAALCWCLYGVLPDGSKGADLVSWNATSRSLCVTLTLSVDDVEHTLQRTTSPNIIALDGKRVEQPEVERLVGMSLGLFKHTIYLAQSQPLFHDLAPREKLDLLTEALGLERWETYSEQANESVKTAERALVTLEGEITGLQNVEQELLTQVNNLLIDDREWRFKRKGKMEEYVAKQKQLQQERKEALATIEQQKRVVKDNEKAVKLAKVHLDKQRAHLEVVQEERADNKARMAELEQEAERLLKMVRAFKSGVAICPTCKQPIKDQTALTKHKDETFKAAKEVGDALKQVVEFAEKLDKKRGELKEDVAEAEKAYEGLRRKGEAELGVTYSDLQHLERSLEDLESDMKEYAEAQSPYQHQLNRAQIKQRWLHWDIATKLEQREDSAHAVDAIKFWVKGFKDVRLFILSEVVQELELVTNTMLDAFGLSGWEMHFDVERETKSGTVQRGLVTEVVPSTGQAGVKWQRWSGGEGQRLRLIGALALSQVLLGRVGVEVNMEFLDEPVHFIGENGVEDICTFLAERAREQGRKVLLVDHMALESSMFSGTVRVTKTVEGSKVEVL